MQKPSSESRHLYAGGRFGSKQVHPKLILDLTSEPSFDLVGVNFDASSMVRLRSSL